MTTGHRILFHSVAPWHPTGYGTQTAAFATRFKQAGHDVAILANHGLHGSTLMWGDDIPVYPSDDVMGHKTVRMVAKKHEADLVIGLMDVWPLQPPLFQPLNHATWVPVDHEPCPPKVSQFFHRSGSRPVAMSRFGEQALRDEGLDPLYVPHGINTNIFQPREDRNTIREAMGFPTDAFIVGMVANNAGNTPSRKGFPEALQAFSRFRETHPDAHLWLHTCVTGDRAGTPAGLNIPLMCQMFGIPADAVSWPNQFEYEFGIPDTDLAALYGAFDVLLNPSYGEGFGIPIVEAQACGTPVIVSDWTAMRELCGAGWKITGEPFFDAGHYAYYLHPFVNDIIEALHESYGARGDQLLRDKAREFALGYDADLVMAKYWAPAIEELVKPHEVPPLNRQMRRAMRKAA
ncbi:RfaG Glycosyltransferase [uncultured Caudovirales phage]|uniref:RfaG Glycosyltransferase n=1 Tax=uncultured Caudovirales phage TaxID=2100421 RepID=A0A6J5PTR8_9CAUD|nr:RfaG Glycosyltransferase [uncultured Caudovirales phage]CAB4189356.1 RfaG Glycosyltransferase [uncultured Caudovirales phage]CAB4192462.1 RfaG Glycosyltransferase [uncultured Caudovirales phage]CAB4215297.1 RfaG Glycosyltransferase [uncultured Caudovirales phage]CAB5238907.1 RfaG Glycosyltransferase [uncultured Caudovirales phage]